jgi:hypothetical protein
MKTKTHFASASTSGMTPGAASSSTSLVWTTSRVAGATYRAAVARWPAARITLRQVARVGHESAGSRDKKMQTPPRPGAASAGF